jgi:PPOX class probable F420-dependent enzyme
MIDKSTALGALVARHLREDRVAWLTTVTPAGAPLPAVVWFLWDEQDTVHIFSKPDAPRLRNLRANPKVALHFDGDGSGGDIVVLSGEATIGGEPADRLPEYVHKYGWGFQRIGITAEQFAQRYSVPLAIRLTKARGHK